MKKSLMRATVGCILAGALALPLAGCTGAQPANGTASGEARETADASVDISQLDLEFTKRDLDASYDEASATNVALSDAGIQVEGAGATAEGSALTLFAAGTYVLTGSLSNGSITVAAGDEDKLQVVFKGVTVHNEAGPALYVDNADKVFVTLAEGSENALSDGAEYQLAGDDDTRDATVFSRDDLTFNGTGALSVTGSYKHAICSNDDLVITGGTYTVTSVEDALRGKDCLKVADGAFTVNAGDDAFHTEAYLYMEGGTVNVESCYEGYESEQVIISGGAHTIVASDDGLNAALADSNETDAADVVPEGAAPEGAPADAAANDTPPELPDGAEMPQRPDGALGEQGAPQDGQMLERGQMPEDGGRFQAPTGNEEAPTGNEEAFAGKGAFDGGQMAQSSSSCLIQINGGTLHLTAGNDGIDSNGNVEFNGGTVLVSGPDAGMDGSLDYDLSATVTGGTLLMVGSVGSTQGLSASAQAVTCGSVQGKEGQEVSLVNANGTVLVSFQAATDFSQVLASSSEIGSSQTFSILVDGQATELTAGEGLDMRQNGGMGTPGGRGADDGFKPEVGDERGRSGEGTVAA